MALTVSSTPVYFFKQVLASGSTSPRIGPAAADRLLDDIKEARALLANHPQLGPARPEIAEACRSFTVGHDLILHHMIPEGIDIVRVSRSARRLDTLFSMR